MATKKQEQYGNSSISMLKGEDRVRKRPAVIFGSDDLEGCKHAVFAEAFLKKESTKLNVSIGAKK